MLPSIIKKISKLLLLFILVFNAVPIFAVDNIQGYTNCALSCQTGTPEAKLACFQSCRTAFPQGYQEYLTQREQERYEVTINSMGSAPITPCVPSATHFCLNIPIGRLTGFDVAEGGSIMGDYIKSWYGFMLGSVGILATVMIMWGGFKYLVSRGDKASIESAKTQMISAVTGVVLAFGTYTLLYLINPALLTINTPNLPGIQGGDNVNLTAEQAGIDTNEGSTSGQVNATGLQPKAQQVRESITAHTGTEASSLVRAGDPNLNNHANGSAIDFPRNQDTNAYFTSLIGDTKPSFYYNGQPGYVFNNISINEITYQEIRVINESSTANNCWHIDLGKPPKL